jgi:hypothetical protein
MKKIVQTLLGVATDWLQYVHFVALSSYGGIQRLYSLELGLSFDETLEVEIYLQRT